MRQRPKSEPAAVSPLVAFGLRIRAIRIHLGLSQEELGQRADRHWTHVALIERGKGNPTLMTFLALAAGLDVDPRELLGPDLPENVSEPTTSRVRPGGRRPGRRPRARR